MSDVSELLARSQNKCDRQIILPSVVCSSFVSFSEISRLRRAISVEYDKARNISNHFLSG